MFVPDSKKHQPEFDLAKAQGIYSAGGYDRELGGEWITSPHDLFSVETLRDRFDLREGRAIPADVFVFGKGEPPRPDCTHIGGRPFWPASRKWPTDEAGEPYKFFAQINFADSRDLVGKLPGDLLLLFIGDEDEWYFHPMQVQFEWVALGSRVQTEFDPSLIANTGGPFFGAIYRTADYPDAVLRAEELRNLPPDSAGIDAWRAYKPTVDASYNLPILNGTKIGGLPHFVQSGEDVSGQFLCQLASIQAAAHVPYPWVNCPEPLGLGLRGDAYNKNGTISDKENELLFGDLGSIYIYRDADGQVRSAFECY